MLTYGCNLARIPDHLTMMDPKHHAQRKKIVNHFYSTTFIAKLEEHMDSVIDLFLSRMEEFAASAETFDLMGWLQMFVYFSRIDIKRLY